MGLAQPVITQQMVIAELTKAGIKRDIAIDLSYRYYKNELTYKDIEFLKENFDIKLKHLEDGISSVKDELNTKIDTVENNFNLKLEKVEALLQSEIKSVKTDLDNKIDSVENNLNTKIEKVESSLQAEIKSVKAELDNKIDTKFNELDNKIDTKFNVLDNKLKLHGWMFGTLITLNIGIFLALMSLLVK
ncbi:Bdr family repetitive protein [Borrelia puertoricensis]|uniref:Bdr family repetitive protein n=1 Tax=Borrelia puertoricensis TaxID=2756107 RepID=UPI001FF5ED7E|nr:Bdr family repetitive protein [Borrelia puertoricensis]